MTIYLQYTPLLHSDGTISKVPLVPIEIMGKEIFYASGLVDSGADMCAISKPTAEILGLSLAGDKETGLGVGGKTESVQTQITMRVASKYTFLVPIKIILSDEDFPMLLGQKGFFDKFIIKFNKHKEKFSLKRIGSLL